MKCPKCGFVSYAGLSQCKKCGQPFIPSEVNNPKPLNSEVPVTAAAAAGASAARPSSPSARTSRPESEASATKPSSGRPVVLSSRSPLENREVGAPTANPVWQQELSTRVQEFRRRRARLRGGADPGSQLDMGFELDLEEPEPQPAAGRLRIDALPLKKHGEDLDSLSWAAVEAGELPIDDRASEAKPVEIVLESSTAESADTIAAESPLAWPAAPLGQRFLAGMIDAMVLMAGVALFASVFWFAGGRMSPRPVNIAVLAFVAVSMLVTYFGLFTSLIAATPGMHALDLEVRNWDGNYPTTGECFERAFGYLVSITALMLGFIWALVDSQYLTWHDRMSGTFVTERD